MIISFVNFNLDKVFCPLLKSVVKVNKNAFSKTSGFLSIAILAKNVIETGYKNKKKRKKKKKKKKKEKNKSCNKTIDAFF